VVGAQNFTDPAVLTTLLVGAILMLGLLMPTARRLGARRADADRPTEPLAAGSLQPLPDA
jgi:hypothetical protein